MYFCSGLSRSFLLQNAARSVCTGRAAFRFALLFIPAIGAGLAALAVFGGKKLKEKKAWKEFTQCEEK